MKLRVAAAQYPIDSLGSWGGFEDKLSRWFKDAAEQGAQLLVFPEYGSMELARLADQGVWSDLSKSIDFVGGLRNRVDALHAELAERHNVYVVAASLPERDDAGKARNTARLISPGGDIGEQHKLMMTRFEREKWGIVGGQGLRVFETRVGLFGICICYDVEFPLIARALAESGAVVLLAPSCTESMHGYHRVRVGSQARALENQCFVLQSPTVGEALWSPAVDRNVGAAGVYGPPDLGFPADGVISTGALNEPSWLIADLDLSLVANVRKSGSVFNHRDWHEQPGAASFTVEVVSL